MASVGPWVPPLSLASFSLTLPLGHCLLSFLDPLGVCLSLPLPVSCLVSLSISLGVFSLSVHCLCSVSMLQFLCVPDSLCLSISVSLSSHPGAIQSFAGFTDYFTAMAQEGWFPLLCVGLRPQWEDHHLQDLQDRYGQEWVSPCPHPLSFQCHLLECGPHSLLHA